jgi:transposase
MQFLHLGREVPPKVRTQHDALYIAFMKRRTRQHDEAFRRRAVELLISGRPLAELAREIGVATPTLWRWKQRYLAQVSPEPQTDRSAKEVFQENKELRRRLKELETHHEILKKALGILSQPPLPPSMS